MEKLYHYSWLDLIRLDDKPIKTINELMKRVFEFGVNELEGAIGDGIEYITDTEDSYGIAYNLRKERSEFEMLDPHNDLSIGLNFPDTEVYCERHEDIYRKYLGAALYEFCEGTGFEIRFD